MQRVTIQRVRRIRWMAFSVELFRRIGEARRPVARISLVLGHYFVLENSTVLLPLKRWPRSWKWVNEPVHGIVRLLDNLPSGKPPKLGKHTSIGGADYSYRYQL